MKFDMVIHIQHTAENIYLRNMGFDSGKILIFGYFRIHKVKI